MENWASIWWIWISGALVLAILEVVLPGYIFLGFALGALALGALLFMGVSLSAPIIWLAFAVLSLAAYLALRKIFGLKTGQVKIFKDDING